MPISHRNHGRGRCAWWVPQGGRSGCHSYPTTCDASLTALDSDGNSRLSAAELLQILGPLEGGAVDAATRTESSDLENDDELADGELRRSLEFRYQWLDKNPGGNVDPAELAGALGVPMIGGK